MSAGHRSNRLIKGDALARAARSKPLAADDALFPETDALVNVKCAKKAQLEIFLVKIYGKYPSDANIPGIAYSSRMPTADAPQDKKISAAQCRGARGMLGWTLDDLSRRSGVSRRALTHFEADLRDAHQATMHKVVQAFHTEGIMFINNDDDEGLLMASRRGQ